MRSKSQKRKTRNPDHICLNPKCRKPCYGTYCRKCFSKGKNNGLARRAVNRRYIKKANYGK